MDSNTYPDLLIGAFDSDRTVFLRARPIIRVSARVDLSPSVINLEEKFCTLGDGTPVVWWGTLWLIHLAALNPELMASILKTTFLNAFPWNERLASNCQTFLSRKYKFDWILFLRVQLTVSWHWFRKRLVGDQVISLSNDPVKWRHIATLDQSEWSAYGYLCLKST